MLAGGALVSHGFLRGKPRATSGQPRSTARSCCLTVACLVSRATQAKTNAGLVEGLVRSKLVESERVRQGSGIHESFHTF
jgi:hypothetical protein